MALITCRCGRQISDKAKFCPHCGFVPNTICYEPQPQNGIANEYSGVNGLPEQDGHIGKNDLIDEQVEAVIKSEPVADTSPEPYEDIEIYEDDVEPYEYDMDDVTLFDDLYEAYIELYESAARISAYYSGLGEDYSESYEHYEYYDNECLELFEEMRMNISESWHLYYDDDADFENKDDDWTKDPQ